MYNNTTCFLPDNFSTACGLTDYNKKNYSSVHMAILPNSVIIAIMSPVAVVGNSLILAAIWKKAFLRTPFHILLSALVLTDLCTGLIAQPFVAATNLLYLRSPKVVIGRPVLFNTIKTIGDVIATYSISITLLELELKLEMAGFKPGPRPPD